MSELYEFEIRSLDGRKKTLSEHQGKVLLIVNVASKCGFTPQYEGLEKLHRDLESRGFAVLGFPCNQFGKQEPGTAKEIADFCKTSYGVSFPMYEKIEVNGRGAHLIYRFLTASKKGALGNPEIEWNFEKFLVDREGKVVARYDSRATPEAIRPDIERLL